MEENTDKMGVEYRLCGAKLLKFLKYSPNNYF